MVVSLYMAEAELLAELEVAVLLGVVLVQVLQEGVQSQERQGWMRKIGVDHNTNGYMDWISSDMKAKLQIATTLCKGALNIILQASSIKDCWECLIAQYQGKGGHHIAYLMQSFYRTMLTNTKPMELQLNKLVEANQNLETIRCRAANDKSLAYLIIIALLELLSTLQAILFNKDDNTVLSNIVIMQILANKEQRINLLGRTTMAYFAKASRQGANRKNWDKN